MDETNFRRKIIKIITFFTIAVVFILGYDKVTYVGGIILSALFPFLAGGVFAVILNMPVRFFENRVFKWNGRIGKKIKRPISIFLSLLIFLGILGLVGLLVIPQLIETFKDAANSIPSFLQNFSIWLEETFNLKEEWLNELHILQNSTDSWKELIEYISKYIPINNSTFDFAYGFVANLFGSFINTIIAVAFGIYSLMLKEKISGFCYKLSLLCFGRERHQSICHIIDKLHSNFEDFIFGQCLECFIVASIFTLLGTIFGFECTLIVGVLMLFLALIPYIGNTLSCIIGIILTLAMENPIRAIWFAVLFAVIQLLDAYFLYPKVIGLKVNMPPILIFVSAIVGGSLFGFFGMIFMIPVMTTVYMIIKEKMNSLRDDYGEDETKKDLQIINKNIKEKTPEE